ncbi:hypothetical protein [Pseudomonas sp. Snoq117.2]|uniref:hypothetical protein n=1 Tax=Pseudomonas sp. Snoq117.2 TaxID=1500302 RepID=UPI0008B1050D|nr:hypothetical protein [Pseudomonas sp. Snoq117.2]SEO71685.1 hypothetical protein SAMN02787149_1011096 [Pseudomonas sp. Snoq117.2]
MAAVSVYIDNNVWDFLFARGLDLSVELPSDRYCLCMTREAEFEIPPISPEKAELKRFIEATVAKCVKTVPIFGFYDESLPPDEQRAGGFGVGRYASDAEIEFVDQQRKTIGNKKRDKSKLYKNEADVSIASRSFESVVLSLDAKKGPINTAYKQGGLVVFLTEFDGSSLSLSNFVDREIGKCDMSRNAFRSRRDFEA